MERAVSITEQVKVVKTDKKTNKKYSVTETKRIPQEIKQSVKIGSEAVKFFCSEEGKIRGITPSSWKKMSKKNRLEANLQVHADYLSGKTGTKYSYEVIN